MSFRFSSFILAALFVILTSEIDIVPRTEAVQDVRLELSLLSAAVPDSTNLIWIDEFEQKHPRWDWNYQQGTGYKRLIPPANSSAVEIGITRNSARTSYSDGSLHEAQAEHLAGKMEARLRMSDGNGLEGGSARGTRGWGFWNADLEILNAAWFWSASPESHPDLSGFKVMVIRSSEIVFSQEIPSGLADMSGWHTYGVELSVMGTKFFIDGEEFASTPLRPENLQRIELWVDNMAVDIDPEQGTYQVSYLDLENDQQMFIDWVSLSEASEDIPEVEFTSIFLPMIVW